MKYTGEDWGTLGIQDSLRFRFWLIISTVAISGFTQGMLIPIIAIIFEQDGVPSSINGLHAAGLYIGILIASPFMEGILRKFGYRTVILTGMLVVILCLALFPLWKSISFWFILRLLIGVGNNMLHLGSQTWLTSFSTKENRGRNISLYGLSFGLGFGVGPMLTRLLEISEALPFMISSGLSLIVFLALLTLKNEYPEQVTERSTFLGVFSRFKQVWTYAWVATLLPFTFGFLEASLNGNFPVYALRVGIDISAVSIILPAFAIGSIILQLPLGIMSDRYGRRNILIVIIVLGLITFTTAGIFQESVIGLFICFFIAGMLVGSTYSLGISYLVDLLPRHLLPAGNVLCGILYSFGSISGPFAGGLTIQYLKGISFFYSFTLLLFVIFLSLVLFKPQKSIVTEGKVI